ncbi:DNA polymerase III subunit delta' [Antarcticirhabdus aurantiaca]|uniref:DNA polymerase III subunit delta n=1 Tax=Antarcticirhabdus aurantiaca TaxID=2606717 RepID=A0ACD4NVZ1_9HYPH|nr:DNA polymerase III subunit delta' [Antarcticirhabdus aurantiaca]WAJ30920.1 DNA polymerase III subunit delta' [Jeongeuplla avenae]
MSLETDVLAHEEGHDDFDGIAPPAARLSIVGHREPLAILDEAARSARFHHGWILEGPRGIGKATAAFAFARRLLVGLERPEPPSPDDPIVRQIAQDSYPGLIHLQRPKNEKTGAFRSDLTVSEVRKLNRFFHRTADEDAWRIAIVDPADDLNASAANALLKILEEPPERSLFLIVAHRPAAVLPTIRSRCRALRFDPLEDREVADILSGLPHGGSPEAVRHAVAAAAGSVRRALSQLLNGGDEIRAGVERILAASQPDWLAIQTIADALVQKGREVGYDLLVNDLLDQAAERSRARLAAGDAAEAARYARLWQDENARLRRGAAYNLDKKQMLMTLFGRFFA